MISPRIFLPLLDNGNGSVMASFMMDHTAAFAGREAQMIRASDSHANRGMNYIANRFLDSDCEVWINLDADIRFRRVDIDNLLSHDLPLVYGIYPKKEEATSPCLCTFPTVPVPDPITGLAEVRRCGRGFMLVKREVLEAMKEDNGGPALRYHNHGKIEWDFFPSGVVTGAFSALAKTDALTFYNYAGAVAGVGHSFKDELDEDGYPRREWISEDWYFCEVARSLGYKTFVDTNIALGHVGQKEYHFGADQVTRVTRESDRVNTHEQIDSSCSWQNIQGWFTEADAEVYRLIADAIPADGGVAEIGSWFGRSMGALLTFCRTREKRPLIYAIDTFQGTPGESYDYASVVKANGGSVRAAFEANMKAMGANGNVIVYELESIKASRFFSRGELDAVFLDGDHTYEAVRHEIAAWLPAIKPGGIIAGHDYHLAAVAEAVHEMFLSVEVIGRCWLVRL